ncbi:MAG: helix-turn-helix transcriptional regulator [Ruminococcus sp.]|nr:helix-turn-helix transcriptional regulator [Ruminococcus sp.]
MLVVVNKENLISKREQHKLSRRQLALKAELPVNSVWRMETEDMRVSKLRLAAVSNVLGCDVNELIRT